MRGQPVHNTRPHARLATGSLDTNAWMTSQLNEDLICRLCVSFICLAYFFDMLSIGIFTTRHWQTSGRLVQESNPCTVVINNECRRSLFLTCYLWMFVQPEALVDVRSTDARFKCLHRSHTPLLFLRVGKAVRLPVA